MTKAVAKIEVSLAPALNPKERDVIIARQHKKIKEYSDTALLKAIQKLVIKAQFDTKHNFEKADLNFTITEVCNDLLNDFAERTVEEAEIAFRKGVRKQYGEFYGLSVVTFYQWMVSFVHESNEAIMKQRKFEAELNNQPPVLSQKEKDCITAKYMLEFFEKYKENPLNSGIKIYIISASVEYDYLLRLKVIGYNDQQKADIRERAKKSMERTYDLLKAKDKMERQKFSAILAATHIGKPTNEFWNECKKVAMLDFYKKLETENKDLRQLLKNAINGFDYEKYEEEQKKKAGQKV